MRRAYFFLLPVVVGTVTFCAVRLQAEEVFPSNAWKALVSNIHPGLRRADVDAWLKEWDGGPQGIDSTRYFIEPDIIVEVPYDQTGGTWTPENRVCAPVHVIRRLRSAL
jgi:hypothetical protein